MVHFASSSDGRVVSMEIESGIVNQDFVYYFKNEFECSIENRSILVDHGNATQKQ